jgi:hypothetical protein
MVNMERKTNSRPYTLKTALYMGGAATLAVLGFNHFIVDSPSAKATAAVTADMPDFKGQSAGQFLSHSPSVRAELRDGKLVEVAIDPFPLGDSSMRTPDNLDNLAWDVTPRGGDFQAVSADLQDRQDPNPTVVNPITNEAQSVVTDGEEFIVPATPGAVKLAEDEAKQQ